MEECRPPKTETSPPEASDEASSGATAEERLQALEHQTTQWKAAVAAQLNDAARKNRKLRDELKQMREEKEQLLTDLRVQLNAEFKERTIMQREELQTLQTKLENVHEEKKLMSVQHEEELKSLNDRLRGVLQIEMEADYRKKSEQAEKDLAGVQHTLAAKEKELEQADHEAGLLKMRITRLSEQYGELAGLLQAGATSSSGQNVGQASPPLVESGSPTREGSSASRGGLLQQNAAALTVAHAQQVEAIRAELQSKEQQSKFLLDRVNAEHEVERSQLMRELQLREDELLVSHTLLKQVQMDSNTYVQRISRIQTQQETLEQGYTTKIAALDRELADGAATVQSLEQEKESLLDRLKASQQQVAALEEEAVIREEALHSLVLSENSKKVALDMQQSLLAAREEAEEWKLQYFAMLDTRGRGDGKDEKPKEWQVPVSCQAGQGSEGTASEILVPSSSRKESWAAELKAREAAVAAQESQLQKKAQLLDAAEAKLQDMRRSMAMQASHLLKQQLQDGPNGRKSGHSDVNSTSVLVDQDRKENYYDLPALAHSVVSFLPAHTRPGVIRYLDSSRRGTTDCLRACGGRFLLLQRSPRLFIGTLLTVIIFIYCLILW